MTCNLGNHEAELKSAFDVVSNSGSGKHWCIFEYDGNSSIIRVGAQGDSGGLEELIEQFNSGKIQYGFASIQSSPSGGAQSGQRKIVLIHWQGEGVPAARLATTAAHMESIRRFVRLVHLTIYARNEEDVELQSIYKQLAAKLPNDFVPNAPTQNSGERKTSNASSASSSTPWIPPAPVGTDYSPVKAQKDIDQDERAKFWNEMRAEEESRRREEALKKEEQQKQFAEERKRLDKQLHETHIKAGAAQAPKSAPPLLPPQSPKKGNLISGRTQMFEQKVAEIVNSMPKPLKKPKNFKYQVGLAPNPAALIPVNSLANLDEPRVFECKFEKKPNANEPKVMECKFEKRPNVPEPTPQVVECAFKRREDQIPVLPVPPVARKEEQHMQEEPVKHGGNQYEEPPCEPNNQPVKGGGGDSLRARALWDYQAEDDTEISFNPDEIISEVEQIHDGWWRGRAPNGIVGLFPSNYVELIQ